jgi:hypothetical protein
MNIDEAIGYYTYRSFRNEPVGAPNAILFADAEILLFISDDGAVSGTLSFPVRQGAKERNFLDLSGSVTNWDTLSFRFNGKGRAGSATADFDYEYDCRVAHEWGSAIPPQRLSLVGTVRRNKDHGGAKAGVTASFIAVKRDFIEPRTIPGVALIPEAVEMLAGRAHRLRHTVWHALRGDWHRPKVTDEDRKRFAELGWHLSDPPFRLGPGNSNVLDLTNGAGEDFLYMHRRMIGMLREVYEAAGQAPPTAWTDVPGASAPQFAYREAPDPNNPQQRIYVLDPASSGFMVPPPTATIMEQVEGVPFFRFNKTARGLTNLMRNMTANLRNPRILSQLTLGAYGNLVEFTAHNWMHTRWMTLSRNPQTDEPEVRDVYDIDPRWDAPEYDYLGDFHSSHVNPVFWRLHGWVDDCIEAWWNAHEAAHPGEVQRAEVRGIAWFEKGPWVIKEDPLDWPGASDAHGHGGHHGHGGNDDEEEIKTLEQVMALLKEIDARPEPAAGVAAAAAPADARATLAAALPAPRLQGFARFSQI